MVKQAYLMEIGNLLLEQRKLKDKLRYNEAEIERLRALVEVYDGTQKTEEHRTGIHEGEGLREAEVQTASPDPHRGTSTS